MTKSALLNKINKVLIIEDMEIPESKLGPVPVRIAYGAVCRFQLNEIRGLKSEDKFLPRALGHEGSGANVGRAII